MGKNHRIDFGRRAFLRNAAVLPFAYAASGAVRPQTAQTPGAAFPGVIMRQHSPDNLEFPFASLDGFIVPNNRFYVRSHFPVPTVDASTWRLRVEGAVERPLELSMDDIRQLPQQTAP